MKISWTNDNQLKIIADVDTFKKIKNSVDLNNENGIYFEMDDFINSDFDPSQIDLEQSIHPGVNKNYDVKLNGYDLELISHVEKTGRVPFDSKSFDNLADKIRKQVPYEF